MLDKCLIWCYTIYIKCFIRHFNKKSKPLVGNDFEKEVSMKIFINGIRATYLDLQALFHNLRNKKDSLKNVIHVENEIHFETI